MREFSTPSTVTVPTTGNLTDDVVRNAREAPDAVVLSHYADGRWTDVTAAEFLAQVRGVARGLLAAGVEAGDRVALMSRTRYEWTLLDYAIWFAGAVTVPVYETATVEHVAWILRDAGVAAVVVETEELRARVGRATGDGDLPVWVVEAGAVEVLTADGAGVDAERLEQRRRWAGPSHDATLIYTSGTTGRPKGCRLTHGNFLTELAITTHDLEELFAAKDASTLLFLPLAHVFSRVIQVGAIRSRVRLGHSSDFSRVVPRLQEFRPTFVLAVPRVFEKMFNSASQHATADNRGALFDRAADTAVAWSRGLDRGRPSLSVRARHAVFERLVYARLRESFGGRCTHAVSGGAPLGERLGHFYRGIGITVLEGYGLTETTAAVTVNRPDAQKVGTVGRPLPGTSVRVADDGELLFRGGQVFPGYWTGAAEPGAEPTPESLEAQEATRQALDGERWLHTGDVGEVDDEGFVRVTGRKREILVTAGGKFVAPAVLEERLRAHPLVSQALVVGDRQPFIAALVTLDPESLAAWAGEQALPTSASVLGALAESPALVAEIQRAVDEANAGVSRAESIRRFLVLGDDWTEEGGHLTPSLKLKRNVVLRDFKDEIASLYL